MKEDITQRSGFAPRLVASCGLVMKEDITQLQLARDDEDRCCGLVMKEDITQLSRFFSVFGLVVVW